MKIKISHKILGFGPYFDPLYLGNGKSYNGMTYIKEYLLLQIAEIKNCNMCN